MGQDQGDDLDMPRIMDRNRGGCAVPEKVRVYCIAECGLGQPLDRLCHPARGQHTAILLDPKRLACAATMGTTCCQNGAVRCQIMLKCSFKPGREGEFEWPILFGLFSGEDHPPAVAAFDEIFSDHDRDEIGRTYGAVGQEASLKVTMVV